LNWLGRGKRYRAGFAARWLFFHHREIVRLADNSQYAPVLVNVEQEWAMFYQLGEWTRKVSMILVLVGCVGGFWTEVTSDVSVGKNGRKKAPLLQQRLTYCGIIALGIPGSLWSLYRTVTERQRTLWE